MTPFPRAPFLALVANIVGCHPLYVTWKGSPEPSYVKPAAPFIWASMRIGSSSRAAVGADDLRNTDHGDGTFTVNAVGRRQIILSVDCFTYDSPIANDADEILALFVTRIYSPDNLDALNAMALVVETESSIVELPTTINGRYISAAHVDLTVALANQDAAKYPGGNQWVGEVQTSGNVGTGVPQTSDVVGR